jgi:enoyl-CoA hydratase/carnithine racemase
MSDFESYEKQFKYIHMRREDGILELRLHSDGGTLQWGIEPHDELATAFRAIARDPQNRVMIITGTGDAFTGPRATDEAQVDKKFHAMPAQVWERPHSNGMELMDSLLSIQALVIGAVNGPALRHCELALLSDIVIASENAEFQDSAHFPAGLTPGDGINVITPLAMGLTRSHYFHLTGQSLDARKAMEFGLVNEVVKRSELTDRAWTLARQLLKQKPMVIRHTRLLHTHEMRRRMLDMVGYGLALEGLDVADAFDSFRK